MTDRIAGTFLMGLDVAVEFATLGEFRLVEADASPAPDLFQAAPLVRRPARLAATELDRTLLPPASTAIARAAAESAARVAARRKPARPALGPKAARPALRPGTKAVIPSAPRRRAAGPAHPSAPVRPTAAMRGTASKPRKRGGAVEAGTQLCLFSR
ncbi:MAG TPA: hypothetical protein VH300_04165 [Thermoleophilaceae bacterium]|nr:hypothetical protein [Thermoleophilaceae bacterium]